MKNIRKIAIIIIVLIIVASIIGCEKVLEVKRIDTSQAQENTEPAKQEQANEKVDNQEKQDKNQDDKTAVNSEKDLEPKENQEIINKSTKETEKTEATKGSKVNDQQDENKADKVNLEDKEKAKEDKKETVPATSQKVNATSGFLQHLYLTDTYKDAEPGGFKLNYLVGEDHFVHLLADYYTTANQAVPINIYWQDAGEQVIYKKEELEKKPDENNIINIHSILGLTKKVEEQQLLPDALGEYWVIIEVEERIVSKTRYNIVGNF